jgi:uncharacterized membrane protein
MTANQDYHFSLFKPFTEYGRKIRNLILIMLSIWAVAVFGFQILLKVVEKPTPESTLERFETAWRALQNEDNDPALFREFLHSQVITAGKIGIKAADREILSGGINLGLRKLVPDSVLGPVLEKIPELAAMSGRFTSAKDQQYQELKMGMAGIQSNMLEAIRPFTGFREGSLQETILLSMIKPDSSLDTGSPEIGRLPAVMKLYLTHNQSFLTDFKFLGFPFHYFYTAVFLLILFVFLCLLYNLRLDRRMKIEKIAE